MASESRSRSRSLPLSPTHGGETGCDAADFAESESDADVRPRPEADAEVRAEEMTDVVHGQASGLFPDILPLQGIQDVD